MGVVSGARWRDLLPGRPTFTGSGTCGLDGSCPNALTLANAQGSHPRQLPQLTALDTQPAFLPDGQTLVLAGRPKPRAPFDLYTVRSSGTGLTRLTTSGARQPAPCANGSIAFAHSGNVYLLSPDRLTHRRLTMRGGYSPDCSPNGHWIAFVRHHDLYLISSNGRRVRQLTTHHEIFNSFPGSDTGQQIPGLDTSRPAFSPTGRQIAINVNLPCVRSVARHLGLSCCAVVNDEAGCDLGTAGIEVIDLHGRVRRKMLSLCEQSPVQGCGLDLSGGLAWQPLPTRPPPNASALRLSTASSADTARPPPSSSPQRLFGTTDIKRQRPGRYGA